MQVTNFNFSPEEEAAISERNFFLLKNSATQKIIDIFGQLEVEITNEIQQLPIDLKEMNFSRNKIFRGENYKLYPYIILDCPRIFSISNIFAFRTMFWWGHEFSFTLQLQGDALEIYRKSLSNNFNLLSNNEVFFCVNDTPWQYDFNKDNYLPFENIIDRKQELLTKPFVKLSRKLNINSHTKVCKYGIDSFKLFMKLLNEY